MSEGKYDFLKEPQWVQTILAMVVVLGGFIYAYPVLDQNFVTFVLRATGLQLSTLFLVSFIGFLFFFLYAFLINYWTGWMSNTLVFAKIRGQRLIYHMNKDKIFEFIPVKERVDEFYKVKKLGEFRINQRAVGWLKNGLVVMPTVWGHDDGVSFEDIKDLYVSSTDPQRVEDRIRSEKLKAQEEERKPVDIKFLLTMATVLMAMGVAAYLILEQVQEGSCQGQLVELAKTCGQVAKDQQQSGIVAKSQEAMGLGVMKQ